MAQVVKVHPIMSKSHHFYQLRMWITYPLRKNRIFRLFTIANRAASFIWHASSRLNSGQDSRLRHSSLSTCTASHHTPLPFTWVLEFRCGKGDAHFESICSDGYGHILL